MTDDNKPPDFDKFLAKMQITVEEMEAERDTILAWLKGLYSKREFDGNLMPTLFVRVIDFATSEEEMAVTVVPGSFNEGHEKHPVMEKAGRELYEREKIPRSIFIAAEAWMASYKGEVKDIKAQPRDDPNRREVVIINGSSFDQKHQLMAALPIVRPARGSRKLRPYLDFSKLETGATQITSRLLESFVRGYVMACPPLARAILERN
jgi:hypothetical protein